MNFTNQFSLSGKIERCWLVYYSFNLSPTRDLRSYVRILLSRHHSPLICDKVSKLMIPIVYPIKFLPSVGQPTINLQSFYLRFTARRSPLLYNSVCDYIISPSSLLQFKASILCYIFKIFLPSSLTFFDSQQDFQFIIEIVHVNGYERFAFV